MKKIIKNIRTIYTVFVFVALASLDNAVVGLLPPLFKPIANDLKLSYFLIGVVSAANILATAVSSIFWGYFADKGKRKSLIILGTVIWAIFVYATSYSFNFITLFIFQVFTGIGLGCISTIGFSVLSDFFPHSKRGLLMSLWGLSQGFGGIAGSFVASYAAPILGWREPFVIIAVLGFSFIFLYLFIREPQKGESEEEIKELIKEGYSYDYKIELGHIKQIFSNRSNQWLILQGLFMNITTGTLIWLPAMYNAKVQAAGYSDYVAITASGAFYAIFQIGGILSVYFGHLGDTFQKKNLRGRAILTSVALFAAAPLYVLMSVIPMDSLSLPDTPNSVFILLALMQQIIFNPMILLIFIFAIFASAAQSANTPNWLALLADVNLPEHRTTAFAIANVINGFGRTGGNILIGILIDFNSSFIFKTEVGGTIAALCTFQLFFIPAALCYLKIAKISPKDIRRVKSTLRKRAREAKEEQ